MTPPLDLTSLRRALAGLDRGCERSRSAPDDEELRDAARRLLEQLEARNDA
ncbi:MAG: hypothetical protein IPG72_12275 [Ardenticatenales bacterium]|jgi:hypothetical protein|nr:hypothetical protein [Ardenticatenales bacterium]